jgi:hypothetical protein
MSHTVNHQRLGVRRAARQRLEDAVSRTTRIEEEGPAEDRTLSRLSGAGAGRFLTLACWTAPSWRRYTVAHRGGRHCAKPAAGAPTTNTSGLALLDADLSHLTAPPEMRDRRRRDAAGSSGWGSETARIHWISGVIAPGVMKLNEPGPTVVRPKLGLGWPEYAHRWTGTTCRAALLDYSGWRT